MVPSFSIPTTPLVKKQWAKASNEQHNDTCARLAALLEAHGAVALRGDCDPVARLALENGVVTAYDEADGYVQTPVLGTLAQAVSRVLDATLSNHVFLQKDVAHRCVLGQNAIIVLVHERPYAMLTLPENPTLGVLGNMPGWNFAIKGKPTKICADMGPVIVEQIIKRVKKDAPHFVLYNIETGQWYANHDPNLATKSTDLAYTSTPQKAYRWQHEKDAVLHALALTGLYTQGFYTQPTTPGWERCAQDTRESTMHIDFPIHDLPFAVFLHDPTTSTTQEVIDNATLRARAARRRHHEQVGIIPFGAPACSVLAIGPEAPGADVWVALNDPLHTAPVLDTLAALGVPTRKNPHIVHARKEGHHKHFPSIWSLALSYDVATAFVAQAQTWPQVVVASQPWKAMWP